MPFRYSFDAGSGSYHSHFLNRTSAGPELPGPIPGGAADVDFMGFESFSQFDARSAMELVASGQCSIFNL